MDILSEGLKIAGENKDFAALLGILYMSWKTKSAMQVQQAQCGGKFGVQEIINKTQSTVNNDLKKEMAETKDTANKAFECVTKIDKKVGKLTGIVEKAREDYNKYLEDKHNTAKTLTKQEE